MDASLEYDDVNLYGYIFGKIHWNIFDPLDTAYFVKSDGKIVNIKDSFDFLSTLKIYPPTKLTMIKNIRDGSDELINIMIKGEKILTYDVILIQLSKYLDEEKENPNFINVYSENKYFKGLYDTFENTENEIPIFTCDFSA